MTGIGSSHSKRTVFEATLSVAVVVAVVVVLFHQKGGVCVFFPATRFSSIATRAVLPATANPSNLKKVSRPQFCKWKRVVIIIDLILAITTLSSRKYPFFVLFYPHSFAVQRHCHPACSVYPIHTYILVFGAQNTGLVWGFSVVNTDWNSAATSRKDEKALSLKTWRAKQRATSTT